MNAVTGKYLMIKEAVSRFKSVNQPYEVWLDYQKSQGLVTVKTGYMYLAEAPTIYCILTRHMSVYEWCKIANSLTAQGYSPILINSKDLE